MSNRGCFKIQVFKPAHFSDLQGDFITRQGSVKEYVEAERSLPDNFFFSRGALFRAANPPPLQSQSIATLLTVPGPRKQITDPQPSYPGDKG